MVSNVRMKEHFCRTYKLSKKSFKVSSNLWKIVNFNENCHIFTFCADVFKTYYFFIFLIFHCGFFRAILVFVDTHVIQVNVLLFSECRFPKCHFLEHWLIQHWFYLGTPYWTIYLYGDLPRDLQQKQHREIEGQLDLCSRVGVWAGRVIIYLQRFDHLKTIFSHPLTARMELLQYRDWHQPQVAENNGLAIIVPRYSEEGSRRSAANDGNSVPQKKAHLEKNLSHHRRRRRRQSVS